MIGCPETSKHQLITYADVEQAGYMRACGQVCGHIKPSSTSQPVAPWTLRDVVGRDTSRLASPVLGSRVSEIRVSKVGILPVFLVK